MKKHPYNTHAYNAALTLTLCVGFAVLIYGVINDLSISLHKWRADYTREIQRHTQHPSHRYR